MINVWDDRWLPGGTLLRDMCLRPLVDNECNLKLCDLVARSGNRDLHRVNNLLPKDVCDCILRSQPPSMVGTMDFVAWGLTRDEVFSISSAYEAILDPSLRTNNGLFKKVWS